MILSSLNRNRALRPGYVTLTGHGSFASSTGKKVDKETAMTCSAIYAAVRILASAFGKLPRTVSKRDKDGNWIEHRKHWAYPLLTRRPNYFQTAPQFFRYMLTHTFLGGDSYAFIDWDGGRKARQLVAMNPECVTVYQGPAPNYEIIYGFTPKDYTEYREMFFTADQILHWPSLLSMNGITGLSLIEAAANGIGLSLNETEHASANLKQGARPAGVVEYPNKLTDPQYEAIKKSIQEFHGGAVNAGKVLILHNQATWKSIGFSNKDIELIQERKFSVADISRFTGIPLFMLGQEESSSYNSNEQHMLAFMMLSLDPWVQDFDVLQNDKLILYSDRDVYEINTLIEEFNRADTKTNADADATGRQGGWLSANDIRRRRKMSPLKKKIGDQYWRPVNMVDAEDEPIEPAPVEKPLDEPVDKGNQEMDQEKAPSKEAPKDKAKRTLEPSFSDAFRRIDRQTSIFFAKSEGKADRISTMKQFFKEKRSVCAEILTPSVMTAGHLLIDEVTESTRLDLEMRTEKMVDGLIDSWFKQYYKAILEGGHPQFESIDAHTTQLLEDIEVKYGTGNH